MHTARRGAFVLYGMIFALVIMTMPAAVRAADLGFSPATLSFPVGQEFSVKVTLDPAGESVNAADGTVSFDKDVLSVVSVSKDGSAFSLWTADPSFSNSAGTISFSGGTPSSFSKVSNVLTITFKGKKVGSGQISFSKGSVLAADGKGTDVYKNGATTAITITEAAAAPPPEAPPAEEFAPGPTPLAPDITSPTHGKPDLWYSTSTVVFNWKLQPDVLGVRTILGDTESEKPKTELKGTPVPTTEKFFGIRDGISYYFVQFKNDSGWGEIGMKKIQIDTVPPVEFDVALVEASGSDPAKFSFNVTDELSGVDHYDIIIGGTVAASPKAADVANGAFPVPPQEGGQQTVVIKAYDKAGNVREASKTFSLPKVEKPKAATDEDAPPASAGNLWEHILLVIFALALGGIFTQNYYTKKRYTEEKANLLKRVNEASDKNDRVFSAMREEFEQMVNDLDEKPQMTPAEREFLENMKEVLDISEELIGSGTSELKKMIRGQ